MHPSTLRETSLPGIPLIGRGKVRDLYDLGDSLLLVASDRLSAFDVVLPTGIPDKGRVLTQISLFWFDRLRALVPNHLLTAFIAEFPASLQPCAAQLAGRALRVKKLEMLPVECVARGYLAGSGWKEYSAHGTICGIPLPPGLRESDALPEPIFTPATKAQSGHDENIPLAAVERLIGTETAHRVRDLTLAIYASASAYARTRGILIADTKLEFGRLPGGTELILGDEVLTPDSSRFWPAASYAPGRSQDSFDKQYVRDYLETLTWNKQPPGPELPPAVVEGTRAKYREVYQLLTGHALPVSPTEAA